MTLSYDNLLFLLGAALTAAVVKLLIQSTRNPLNKVPGPWLARYTNLPLKLAVVTGQRIHYVHSLHERYGPYVRLSPTEIAVNDAKGLKQIHGINSGFEKSPWYHEVTAPERPVLFAMADAKSHGARRRLFARGFSKTNIRQNWEAAIKERIVLAVSKIQEESARTGSTDVLKWWTLMASDVSSHLMFGESFHTVEEGEINEYIKVLTKALKGNGIGAEVPLVRAIGKLLPFQATKELFCTNDFLRDYAKRAVRNMRAAQETKNIFANIQAETEKGESLDDKDIEVEAAALFVAGTDTTAISLTYLVWAVLSMPDLQRQVEAEVSTLADDFSDADVEALPLLNAVIEETLRLYGAAPGALPRIVPDGGVDMGGYFLPQGSTVSTHAYSTHRDPTLFPEPLIFKPSRWLPDAEVDRVSNAAKAVFSPFGSGSRSCLGLHIAYSELRLAAAEFFRRCPGSRLAPSTTGESMEFDNFFLIAPKAHKCEIVVEKQLLERKCARTGTF